MARIIIVDDYTDLQDFFRSLLELNNFEVRSTGSVTGLNELLQSFTPDLILLDVMLGTDNGRDICKQLKANHKGIIIILISANPKMLVDHEACEADDIIEKPFGMEMVLEKINSLLAKKNPS